MHVVVGEPGLDVVGAPGQHALGRLLQRGQEVVLGGGPRAVAPHHVVGLINWRGRVGEEEGEEGERTRHIGERC